MLLKGSRNIVVSTSRGVMRFGPPAMTREFLRPDSLLLVNTVILQPRTAFASILQSLRLEANCFVRSAH